MVAEFYGSVVPYAGRADVDFFVEMARESAGAVLEIGCGTGRVLIPIARAGIDIVGLDLSPRMLSICREKLALEPEPVQARVRLVQGDMRNFDLGQNFGLVTLPFRPFQHLSTVDDQLSCLSRIHEHLRDGGKFVLDVFNPSLPHLTEGAFLTEYGDEPEFTTDDGRRVIRRMRTISRDHFNQIQDVEFIYYITHTDGREERLVHRFQMRHLFRFEAEHLLVRSGFRVEELYADYDKSPYGSKDLGELIFVSSKV
ncbi:MAG: hypothetical protein BZY88_04170 [SAR202 cluster bacterium Io17-Chloro-G9]|nr:MAG: hypothetical protein BZY88_04170 [SAR202 cluster bacterium Io17-Chloro-G9]